MGDVLKEKQYFVCWRIQIAGEATLESGVFTSHRDETIFQTYERLVNFGKERFGRKDVVVVAFNNIN